MGLLVEGIEWGYGAVGNARWKGVHLKEILEKVGIKKEALEVAFNGADIGVVDKAPDFIKSIPIGRALDENTLLAWEMNGEPLPARPSVSDSLECRSSRTRKA